MSMDFTNSERAIASRQSEDEWRKRAEQQRVMAKSAEGTALAFHLRKMREYEACAEEQAKLTAVYQSLPQEDT